MVELKLAHYTWRIDIIANEWVNNITTSNNFLSSFLFRLASFLPFSLYGLSFLAFAQIIFFPTPPDLELEASQTQRSVLFWSLIDQHTRLLKFGNWIKAKKQLEKKSVLWIDIGAEWDTRERNSDENFMKYLHVHTSCCKKKKEVKRRSWLHN